MAKLRHLAWSMLMLLVPFWQAKQAHAGQNQALAAGLAWHPESGSQERVSRSLTCPAYCAMTADSGQPGWDWTRYNWLVWPVCLDWPAGEISALSSSPDNDDPSPRTPLTQEQLPLDRSTASSASVKDRNNKPTLHSLSFVRGIRNAESRCLYDRNTAFASRQSSRRALPLVLIATQHHPSYRTSPAAAAAPRFWPPAQQRARAPITNHRPPQAL